MRINVMIAIGIFLHLFLFMPRHFFSFSDDSARSSSFSAHLFTRFNEKSVKKQLLSRYFSRNFKMPWDLRAVVS